MSPRTYPVATGQALACVQLPATAATACLRLVGELDLFTAERAGEAVRHAQDESRTLVCDLAGVQFIDLAGLRVLLDAAEHARETGSRMTVAHCPAMVPRLLNLFGLEDALELETAGASSGDA